MSKSRKRTLRVLRACCPGLSELEAIKVINKAYREMHKVRVSDLNREEDEARFKEFQEDVEHSIIKI